MNLVERILSRLEEKDDPRPDQRSPIVREIIRDFHRDPDVQKMIRSSVTGQARDIATPFERVGGIRTTSNIKNRIGKPTQKVRKDIVKGPVHSHRPPGMRTGDEPGAKRGIKK